MARRNTYEGADSMTTAQHTQPLLQVNDLKQHFFLKKETIRIMLIHLKPLT